MKNFAFSHSPVTADKLEAQSAPAERELFASMRGAVKTPRGLGTHLIADLYGTVALTDVRAIQRCMIRCVKESGAKLLQLHLHPFDVHGGVTGVAVLAESHISIHTWPEHRYVAVDAFMCGAARPQACMQVLRETFKPEQCVVQELLRGAIQ